LFYAFKTSNLIIYDFCLDKPSLFQDYIQFTYDLFIFLLKRKWKWLYLSHLKISTIWDLFLYISQGRESNFVIANCYQWVPALFIAWSILSHLFEFSSFSHTRIVFFKFFVSFKNLLLIHFQFYYIAIKDWGLYISLLWGKYPSFSFANHKRFQPCEILCGILQSKLLLLIKYLNLWLVYIQIGASQVARW